MHPPPYGQSLSLLTDLYELTMAFGYWKDGLAERDAVFHVAFRRHPFGGGFTLACGLAAAVDWLRDFSFEQDDLDYLAGLESADGSALFSGEFLEWLGAAEFACDIDAAPEGTLVFPHEPLLRVEGPLWQAQMVESALLNLVNFQTLIATKAMRTALAAGDDPILEFGLRRAQGVDGALAASRASWIGGCAATSNVLAGKLYGIPVRGTHAHSWVMAFDEELESFRAYARALPANCIFLVDTYDSIEGVRNAIVAARELRARGHKTVGIRLDSGDLVELSRRARAMLDEAGFPEARIVASGDLDEHVILDLKQRGARIDVWGVGTRLVTGYDDPALGGVYKLAAIRDPDGEWQDRLKLSDSTEKSSIPGIQAVRRYHRDGRALGDLIHDRRREPARLDESVLLAGGAWPTGLEAAESGDLLRPVFRRGKLVNELPSAEAARMHAQEQRRRFGLTTEALEVDPCYPVALAAETADEKERLVRVIREADSGRARR